MQRNLLELGGLCTKCPDLVQSRSRIVLGYGDPNANIMFIGLAPGRNGADITGVPFTKDPSGTLFQEALIYAGYSNETNPNVIYPQLHDVYVTNLVKCNPQDDKGRNRYPTSEEVEMCRVYLQKELHTVSPRVVILLGSFVVEHVLGLKNCKITKIHNTAIKRASLLYIPFIHPSYVIRGAYKKQQYLAEFASLKRFLAPIN